MDKNKKIAALLESLCERPFEGDPQGQAAGMSAMGSRIAQALSDAQAPRSGSGSEPAPSSRPADESARLTAELAAVLSGTAAVAPCHVFQEAAVTSGAVRLEAQSGLAFVEGIEQASLEAPAHLLEQVLTPADGRLAGGTPAGGIAATPQPGIWSRILHGRLGRRPAQVVVATCAVMLMAGGLSWSLLWRPGDLEPRGVAAPAGTNPKKAPSLGDFALEPPPAPASMPAASAPQALAPAPAFAPAPVLEPAPLLEPAPVLEPAPAILPTPTLAPARSAVQALVDPCASGGSARSEAAAPSGVEAAKRAPKLPSKTAAVAAPDPGCAVSAGAAEAGRNPLAQNPLADVAPLPVARPPAKIGRSDRVSPAAAASAPAIARPASPAMRPTAIQPAR